MIDTDEDFDLDEYERKYSGGEITGPLLAEVKRLRDELDRQMEYIEWLEEFAPKAGEYNTSWDAYELAKGIHWTQMEDEEE